MSTLHPPAGLRAFSIVIAVALVVTSLAPLVIAAARVAA